MILLIELTPRMTFEAFHVFCFNSHGTKITCKKLLKQLDYRDGLEPYNNIQWLQDIS